MHSEGQNNNITIRELESLLCRLAMEWRGSNNNRPEIKDKYYSTIKLLFSLGWDDILDVDCELPEDDMPPEYVKRHPYTHTTKLGTYSWKEK